ncbi:MAG: hypothetical protein PF481_02200 [Bacteroidales bacterium]|jgi:hypothetical protein|nr:hypothetical protein [Bacteroidales bacterium]
MTYTFILKNSDDIAVVDQESYDFIKNDAELTRIQFIKNLRKHASGYAFFQKHWKQEDGTTKCQTIYLHKLIAETFIEKPESIKKLYVRFNNGNPLDCRMENIEWTTLANVIRNTNKTNNKFGYRGVVQDRNKFRAVIYHKRKPIRLGIFDTVEEAAEAYNKKSIELFGHTRSINTIRNN